MKKLTKKDVLTIPNLLSTFRLILAIWFLWLYFQPDFPTKVNWLIAILIMSAVSDFLDGQIARRFNMISEVGKILDPIADKVTQGVLLICLCAKYRLLKPLLVLFAVKESCMAIFGMQMLMTVKQNDGAKWYGKLSTAVFYTVMIILFLFPNISMNVANVLIIISGGCMLLAFVMYMRQYYLLHKKYLAGKEKEESGKLKKAEKSGINEITE